ncbi:hypothetical protein HZS_405 [Henneguya salminicola]|nr:hypothetical protein HZS_405 [Henneguya salminicola]
MINSDEAGANNNDFIVIHIKNIIKSSESKNPLAISLTPTKIPQILEVELKHPRISKTTMFN